jgi:hypothetical protein
MSSLITKKISKSTNNDNNKNSKKIIKEYRLKMNSFNPKDNSPNVFIKNLEYRMKYYYGLYKSKNVNIK